MAPLQLRMEVLVGAVGQLVILGTAVVGMWVAVGEATALQAQARNPIGTMVETIQGEWVALFTAVLSSLMTKC